MKIIISIFMLLANTAAIAAAPPQYWSTCKAQGYDEDSDSYVEVIGSAMNEVIASSNALYFCRRAGLVDCEAIPQSCETEELAFSFPGENVNAMVSTGDSRNYCPPRCFCDESGAVIGCHRER